MELPGTTDLVTTVTRPSLVPIRRGFVRVTGCYRCGFRSARGEQAARFSRCVTCALHQLPSLFAMVRVAGLR